jgi:hypothetical protein
LDLNLRKKLVKWYIWSMAVYGAEAWGLVKLDQKYLKSFEIWCSRSKEKVIRTGRVRNESLCQMKEERISYLQLKVRRTNWIDHIVQKNWHIRYVTEGKKCRVDEEEDVRSYWIGLRKGEDNAICKRKH